MNILFHNLATKNKIILFRLPTHSTHLTRPLDVGVFQPFKHYHTDAINKALVRMGNESLANLSFWLRLSHFATKPLSQQLSGILLGQQD